MVDDGKLYAVEWTPEFVEDVVAAVSYITNELKSPMAAKNLYAGIEKQLDSQRAMPTSATTRVDTNGTTYYIVTHKNWDIYYFIDEETIVAVSLKHHLQAGGRGALLRDVEV